MSRSYHQKHKITRKGKCPWDNLKNYNGDLNTMPEFRTNRKHKPYGLKGGHSGYGNEGFIAKYGFEYGGENMYSKKAERQNAKLNAIKEANLESAIFENQDGYYSMCGSCMKYNTDDCPFKNKILEETMGQYELNCKEYEN